jgi:hypothetical protein
MTNTSDDFADIFESLVQQGRKRTDWHQELNAPFEDDFPVCSHLDFDTEVCRPMVPVGVMSTYPDEFVRRVAAGGVSYLLQLSSIDYTLKKYSGESAENIKNHNRLDTQINKVIDTMLHHMETCY